MKGRAVVPAPLLRKSARPQHANAVLARRDREIAGFWMELGVDGFRIDAVPFLVEERTQM